MASITLGVATPVSIHSFRDDVSRPVQEQADILIGANACFSDDRPLEPQVTGLIDSLGGHRGRTRDDPDVDGPSSVVERGRSSRRSEPGGVRRSPCS